MTAHAATHEGYPMPSVRFDTLAYCKKLKAAGVPEAEAEVHAEALAEVIDKNLATKHDIHGVKKEIHDTAKALRHEIKEMGYKLAVRTGSMLVAMATVLTILNKVL